MNFFPVWVTSAPGPFTEKTVFSPVLCLPLLSHTNVRMSGSQEDSILSTSPCGCPCTMTAHLPDDCSFIPRLHI